VILLKGLPFEIWKSLRIWPFTFRKHSDSAYYILLKPIMRNQVWVRRNAFTLGQALEYKKAP